MMNCQRRLQTRAMPEVGGKVFAISAIIALCASQMLAPPVLAQQQSIEEVVVTARKRAESIHNVPVVVTALGQEQLEKFAINDIYNLSNRTPGLKIGTGQGTFGAQVSMRGIGTSALSASIDQSVALNIDGLQLSQGLAFNAALFDVAQIEVLKGPQGLFFGKNSPGGVISVRTADPGTEAEVIVRAGHEFDAREKRGELVLSGPVGDTLGLRLATAFTDSKGYFTNTARPSALSGGVPGGLDPKYRTFPHDEELIVRGTALWEPSDALRARLKLTHIDFDRQGEGGHPQLVNCPNGLDSFLGIPIAVGDDCRLDDRSSIADLDPAFFPGIPNGGVPYLRREQNFATLELDDQLGTDLTLTSVTGFYDVKGDLVINAATSGTVPTIGLEGGMAREDFTQEVRLTSDYQGRFNFMAGAYYQKSEIEDYSILPVNHGFLEYGFPPRLIDSTHTIDVEAKSLFGQVMWHATPELEFALGARWTDEARRQKTFVNAEFTTDVMFIPGVNAPAWVDLDVPRLSSSNLSPEITATWRPNDDITLFGALKKGFKSGSFNTLGATTSDQSYDDEEIMGGEVGIKTRLLDRRLTFNAAAYYYQYDDMQVGTLENTGTAFRFRTINAASSEIYGVELEADYLSLSIPGLSLRAALNYNHSRFDSFTDAPCYVGQTVELGCDRNPDPGTGLFTAQDLSGRPLLRAPDWTALAGFDYEYPLASGQVLVLGATAHYSSEYEAALAMVRSTRQDAYVKTSASIALRAANNAWELALIGNNLSDRVTSGNCTVANIANGSIFGGTIDGGAESGPAGVGQSVCWSDRGREVHLQFTLRPQAWFRTPG